LSFAGNGNQKERWGKRRNIGCGAFQRGIWAIYFTAA
jgi:hypothetical protein